MMRHLRVSELGTRLGQRPSRGLAVALALLAVPFLGGGPVAADTLHDADPVLPFPLAGGGVVWTGEHAYILGGARPLPTQGGLLETLLGTVLAPNAEGLSDAIVRFTPSTGEVTLMDARLPFARWGAPAAWDGENVYLFGGCRTRDCSGDNEDTGQILRYDPELDRVTSVGVLPSPRHGMAVAFAGDAFYVVGGDEATCHVRYCDPYYGVAWNEVVRFDPATGVVDVMEAEVPRYLNDHGHAAWDGKRLQVVGGSKWAVQYDPANDTLEPVPDALDDFYHARAAAWDGERFHLFGGFDAWGKHSRRIVRYAPDEGPTVMSERLSTTHWLGQAFFDGERAWLLGGIWAGQFRDSILSYDPAPILPTEPLGLSAARGPGRGEISLAWEEPAHHDDISSYRIYRTTSEGDELAAEVAARIWRAEGLDDGEGRTYRVTAVNVMGEGPASASVSQSAPVLPSAPLGLAATAGPLLGQVSLAWQPPADTGGVPVTYDVLAAPEGEPLVPVAATPQPGRVVAGLPDGEAWHFAVRAVNSVGTGPLAAEVAATTPTLPTAPRGLAAVAGPGRGEVTLSWQPPVSTWGAATTYDVYEVTGEGARTFLGSSGGQRTFVDAGLDDGAARAYAVRAVNVHGAGLESDVAEAEAARLPGTVLHLRAEPGPDVGQVLLAWAEGETGGVPLSGYRIWRSGPDDSEPVLVASPDADFARWLDRGLEPGGRYRYVVEPVNVVGIGHPSQEVTTQAQLRPRIEEERALIGLGTETPLTGPDVTVRNGGSVTFLNLVNSAPAPRHDPDSWRDVPCFDFRAEHDWRRMAWGESYEVAFRYDPYRGVLEVRTGDEGFRECLGDAGSAEPDRFVLRWDSGSYYGGTQGTITVRP